MCNLTVAVAVELLELSARLVAFIVTVAGFGTRAGAVYNPLEEIIPTVLLPPATSFTLQVTAVLPVPVTLALNCCVAPTVKLAVVGAIVIETLGGGGAGCVLLPPPHELRVPAPTSKTIKERKRILPCSGEQKCCFNRGHTLEILDDLPGWF